MKYLALNNCSFSGPNGIFDVGYVVSEKHLICFGVRSTVGVMDLAKSESYTKIHKYEANFVDKCTFSMCFHAK